MKMNKKATVALAGLLVGGAAFATTTNCSNPDGTFVFKYSAPDFGHRIPTPDEKRVAIIYQGAPLPENMIKFQQPTPRSEVYTTTVFITSENEDQKPILVICEKKGRVHTP